ncbi:MAG: hypothetical protein JXR51_00320 [Bacteroidales bacterium]|nr:hypothetical protein [Bacteroidales bacterium]MBN2755584.1 hypothetical protein [Bacteroidales bacterium]
MKLKIFFTIIFIASSLFSNAQKVRFKAVFVNQCTHKIEEETNYTVIGSPKYFGNLNYEGNIADLPDTGVYKMYINLNTDEAFDIKIETFGFSSDTFYLPKINNVSYMSNPPFSEYFNCDSLCNGKLTDYYYNGKMRLTSVFKNGQVIDTLKEFYRNGNVKSIYYPYKKRYKFAGQKYHEVLRINYDKNGNCLNYKDSKLGIEKKYYQNGKLKSEYYFKNKNKNYTEYFENGKIKISINKDTKNEYFLNGNLKMHMQKHESFSDKLFRKINRTHSILITYEFQEFDSIANLLRNGKFISDNWEYIFSYRFPECFNKITAKDFREILYQTNPKTKEIFHWNLYYENGDYKGTKTIVTKYELTGDNWIEISKREIINKKFK